MACPDIACRPNNGRDERNCEDSRQKNGSRSPNKFGFRLPLRLIWVIVLLRFQCPLFRRPVSGPISLAVVGCPHFRLRDHASVSNPILVQSPDDCCPSAPLWLAPPLRGFFPIINRKIILSFLRKTICSFRLSSGFRSFQRVIADWSPVPFKLRPMNCI